MHYRNAELKDIPALLRLYEGVAEKSGGIARRKDELSENFIRSFVERCLRNGLIIVLENPDNPSEIIAEIHAHKPDFRMLSHVMTDLTVLVDPRFQGKGIGRTIFTIFLDEIANHRPDVGRVELLTAESNVRAHKLYQSLGFYIEGRFEMRIRTDNGFEADIQMSWQNPGFEFDGDIPRLNR